MVDHIVIVVCALYFVYFHEQPQEQPAVTGLPGLEVAAKGYSIHPHASVCGHAWALPARDFFFIL